MLTATQLVWPAHNDTRQSHKTIEGGGGVVLPLEGQEAQIGPVLFISSELVVWILSFIQFLLLLSITRAMFIDLVIDCIILALLNYTI